MSDSNGPSSTDPPARRWTTEDIKQINIFRGPSTPEEAAFYVEYGAMTPEEAAFWLENRRRTDAFLERDFDKRLQELIEAYRSRRRTKGRIEDDPLACELTQKARKLKKDNPRMTWAQIAGRLSIGERTLYTWRSRIP